MENLTVPTKSEVSENNQAIFNKLEKSLGFVPNLYAYFANNDTALGDYLALQNRKSTLSAKEREVINLVTSQINGCTYCQSAHTAIGKLNGFTDEHILELRSGSASFNTKLDALVKFASAVVNNKGTVDFFTKEAFFSAGYTQANMIDVVMVVGDKIISNYLFKLAQFEIDFPIAKELQLQDA